jgi:DNA repair exonuclease SbcCD ATPase subunit
MSQTNVMTLNKLNDKDKLKEKSENDEIQKRAFSVIKLLQSKNTELLEENFGLEYVKNELSEKIKNIKNECEMLRNENEMTKNKLETYENMNKNSIQELKSIFDNYSETLSEERKMEIKKKYQKYINI